jgi:hypothetical protein
MAQRNPSNGGVTETPTEARGAENSKDSFGVLMISLLLAVIAALVLAWFFGIFPFHHGPTAPTG